MYVEAQAELQRPAASSVAEDEQTGEGVVKMCFEQHTTGCVWNFKKAPVML